MPKLSDNATVSFPILPSFAATLAKPDKKPTCPSYSKESPMSAAAKVSPRAFSAVLSFRGDAKASWLD